MKCSVIIPYYNRKNLLMNTLIALDKQVGMDGFFEVLVIDDGSDIRLDGEINKMGFSIPIRYHYFERGAHSCPAFVRNRGIERSVGDLLVFIDCDIVVKQDFLVNHYNAYVAAKNTEIFQIGFRNSFLPSSITSIEEMIRTRNYSMDMRRLILNRLSENFQAMRFGWILSYGCNISVSRKLIEKYGAFDEKILGWALEDTDIAYVMAKNGVKLVYNPCVDVYHQYHEFKERNFSEWLENLDYLFGKHTGPDFQMMEYMKRLFEQDSLVRIMEDQGNKGNFGQDAYDNAYCDLVIKIDRCLRILQDSDEIICSGHIVLRNPELKTLTQQINHQDETRYTVICEKDDLPLIVEIQTNPSYEKVLLYTY